MEEKKLSLYATSLIALAIVLASLILGSAYKYKFVSTETISTTGLAEKEFTSDLVIWNASFSSYSMDRKVAFESLKADQIKIKDYLISKGIKENEIVFSAINVEEQTKTERKYAGNEGYSEVSTFAGYKLTQNFDIESKSLDIIEKTAREITELLEQGINISSNQPNYYYTKLEDLKISLISNATGNATVRAKNIAEKGNSTLGSLKNATMGVFQITGKTSSEEYSWGGVYNTSDRNKKASITVKLEFAIK
jgi:hypothetical protein